MKENKLIKNLIIILLIFSIIFLLTKIQFIFKPIFDILTMFIGPIIIGGFFYYWLRPATRLLAQGKLYKHKSIIAALVILLFFSIFILVISGAGAVLKDQVKDTIGKINTNKYNYSSILEDQFKKLNISTSFLEEYTSKGKESIKNFLSNLPGIFSGIGDFTTQVVLVPFILYYLLKEEDEISEKIQKIIPKKYKQVVIELLVKLDKVLSTYIVGQLLVALIIGSLMFIGYLIIKMPNALLMASFSVITAVIPMIGAFLGILPALLIAFTIDLKLVLKIILLSVLVQQIEGNIITPNLMGSKLNIHPFVVMIVVIISINLLGLFGAFIGIPLYLVISLTIKEFIKFKKEDRKKPVS